MWCAGAPAISAIRQSLRRVSASIAIVGRKLVGRLVFAFSRVKTVTVRLSVSYRHLATK